MDDKALDEVVAQLKGEPYVESPDELGLKDGALCFLDALRVCGPSCMAYQVEEFDEKGVLIQGPSKCVVLDTMIRGAQVTLLKSENATRRSQDEQRRQQLESARKMGL